ncbi:MAG TPA: hypothetical protein VIU65_03965 [Pyrinomonadaceae bacterium]
MRERQITLPFRARQKKQVKPNVDLIGRSYQEGYSTVTVVETCLHDESRVMLRRDPGGRTWSMPAWLVRLIFTGKKQKRAA